MFASFCVLLAFVLLLTVSLAVIFAADDANVRRHTTTRTLSNDLVRESVGREERIAEQTRLTVNAQSDQAETMADAHKTAVRWSLDLQGNLANNQLAYQAQLAEKTLATAKEIEAMKIEAAKASTPTKTRLAKR